MSRFGLFGFEFFFYFIKSDSQQDGTGADKAVGYVIGWPAIIAYAHVNEVDNAVSKEPVRKVSKGSTHDKRDRRSKKRAVFRRLYKVEKQENNRKAGQKLEDHGIALESTENSACVIDKAKPEVGAEHFNGLPIAERIDGPDLCNGIGNPDKTYHYKETGREFVHGAVTDFECCGSTRFQ